MVRYVRITSLLFSVSFFVSFTVVFSQLVTTQTATLITLSRLLNGKTLTWDVSKVPNPCRWKGISCGGPNNSSVVGLSLSGMSLSSPEIFPVICQIDSLESLDLSDNRMSSISGEFISGCGKIGQLKLLNLSRNRLNGPLPTFQGFRGLEFLDLSRNNMNGNISLQLHGLVGLKSLNLSFNFFTGSVPINLGSSKSLEQLQLSTNRLQGIIPEEIFSYRNLTQIDLSGNHLSGSIPGGIGVLSRLEILVLSSNNLTGEVPGNLTNISSMTRFAAYQNKLTGQIPPGLTKSLSNLDLSYNNINGSIPFDFLSQPNLEYVDLSYNSLEGSIPANLSASLVRLRLGGNELSGVIPSAVLDKLVRLTYLELDNNNLNGSIPAELGLCQNLTLLNLASNKLSGVLPVQLGNLSNLHVLKLQSNKLHGIMPHEIFQLQKLLTLNMSSNMLYGSVPSSISSLQSLTNLHLQDNNLSGSIPALGNLNSLIELQLGHNQLGGKIPAMPTKLQIALNLSNNRFEGQIPATLAQLTNLEVLDLSNNRLSGEIPSFLAEMGSLVQLILSNNLFSGAVPKFGSRVFVDTNGNKVINATQNPSPESTRNKRSVSVSIIVGVTVAVVAVGIITVILLSIMRCFYRVSDDQIEPSEGLPNPQVIQGNLLTPNVIHRSNIDFAKAMEAVGEPSNILLKTRFCTYYKTIMPSGISYFVKKLNWSDKIFQLGSHDKFDQELEVLGRLSNSNVMTPLAYVLTGDSAYLFYEFAQKGTLFDVLHGGSESNLDWVSRYSIAIGVAQALSFLHGCTSGSILLLDLSSRNIFLKSLKEPLVGDIELCKVIDPSKSTGSLSTIAGSVGYIPPEYAYTMRITSAGNVYSFGVVLLELLTGKPAVNEGIDLAKWVSRDAEQQDRWDHIIDPSIGRTSSAARSQILAVMKIALSCVSISPEARPKTRSVLRMLLNAR